LEIKVHPNVVALFNIVLVAQVGNGRNAQFWLDRWFMGCCLGDLASEVVTAVLVQTRESMVAEGLQNRSWPRDIKGSLSLIGLFD
jgi:hypothetical protein